MTEPSHEDLLRVVRTVWEERDPVPDGLVARMQAAAALAANETDLDVELLRLVDRSEELVGTRGASTAYTLRFAHDGADLLLRIAVEGEESRIDGWIVPPEAMTVRALVGGADAPAGTWSAVVSDNGRFELTGLPLGLLRLRLEPHEPTRAAFVTPTFEI